MRVKCIQNTAKYLRKFESKPLSPNQVGDFGVSELAQYNEVKIDGGYTVVGMILFEHYLAYLIDDNDGFIFTCPSQLFEIIDNTLPKSWYFRNLSPGERLYPFIKAVWGYDELCFDKNAYEKLIGDKNEESEAIYFRRKKEIETELNLKLS